VDGHRRLLVVCLVALLAACASPPAANGPGRRVHVARLPLAFEPNVGQAPDRTLYVSRGAGLRVDLDGDGAWLTPSATSGPRRSVQLRWVGSSPPASVAAEDELPGKIHYYGAGTVRSYRDIPTYRQVVYRSVYPGTDLLFHGTHGAAEFDFVVAPGADPDAIALQVDGADALTVDGGDILIHVGEALLRLHAPVLYQGAPERRTSVSGGFRLDGRRIGFSVGEYDRSRPLVIDPVVTYSTYLDQGGSGVGFDAAGNMYSAGGSGVVKLSADGSTLLYEVVLGDMVPQALVVDGAGNAYLASSCPYDRSGAVYVCPTTGNALASGQATHQGDLGMYVTKLGPSGAMLYSSNVGARGSVEVGGIAVDPVGNIYVTGWNVYGGFPTTRPPFARPGVTSGYPVVVEVIAADFSRFIYVATFLSGGDVFRPTGIAVDRTGAAYVTGTAGAQFPTTPGAFQPEPAPDIGAAVLAKIAPDGSRLVYSTYFGNRTTEPRGVAVDTSGSAFITGRAGGGLPTARALQPTPAGGNDAFVTRFSSSGSGLVFSTYLGGGGEDDGRALALDGSANVYLAGSTRSTDFPLRSPLPSAFGAAASNFVTALASDGSAFIYSTYFADAQTSIGDLAVTSNGTVYLTGSTSSTSYPTVRPYQATPGRAFVARIDPAQPRVFITSPAPEATVSGTVVSDVWMENTATGSRTIRLSIGSVVLATMTSTANHVTMTWDSRRVADGTQSLVATVTDASGATGSGSRAFNVQNEGGGGTTLTAAFTSPASGATVSGAVTVGMSQTGASGAPITFTLAVDAVQVFTATGTAPAASFGWNTATVGNGIRTLLLTVRDGGGRTATATRSVTVNNPTGTLAVFITSPAAGATATGTVWSDVWVEGAAAGTRSFSLTIGSTVVGSTTSTSNHVTVAWDSRRVGNGAQTLTATVRDAAGNSGVASRAFNVQNTGGGSPALVASFSAPAAGATVSGITSVGMAATGSSGTPVSFTLAIDGRSAFSTSGASQTATYSWSTGGLANGTHTLALTVRDGAGRTATATRTVTVSNPAGAEPLVVTITAPRAGATVRQTVWFTIWLGGSAAGSKTYTLTESGRTVAVTSTASTGPVSMAWVTSLADNGARNPTVTVRDGAGATGTASVRVTVAN
jgi:Big-like domain-containing protein/beta-propeller repeat-containing protein